MNAREKILSTAGSLFMLRGYELVGVNEIIEKSEVAKATFYNHFKSKESLCYEWLKSVWEDSKANNDSIQSTGSNFEAKVSQKYKGLEHSLINHSYRGCPFSNTKVMLPDSELISKLIVDYKEYSRGFWKQLAKGEGKPEQLGEALFLLYSGATAEAQNAQDLWPVKSALSASIGMANL